MCASALARTEAKTVICQLTENKQGSVLLILALEFYS